MHLAAAWPAGGQDGQEGVGEERQNGPAVPGGPAPDLVFVQGGEFFADDEAFLRDSPGAPCSSQRRWLSAPLRSTSTPTDRHPGPLPGQIPLIVAEIKRLFNAATAIQTVHLARRAGPDGGAAAKPALAGTTNVPGSSASHNSPGQTVKCGCRTGSGIQLW